MKPARALELLNFFMADVQAGIGPVSRRLSASARLGHGRDRHGHDDRRNRGRVREFTGGRARRCNPPQARGDRHRRRNDDAGFGPALDLACVLDGGGLASGDGDNGRRTRARDGGHHARHRAPARLRPAVRPQPGRQSRRQCGGRGALGLARLALRLRRGVRVERGVRRADSDRGSDDPARRYRSRQCAGPRSGARSDAHDDPDTRGLRILLHCRPLLLLAPRFCCSTSAMPRCCRSTGWRSSPRIRPIRARSRPRRSSSRKG